MKNIVLIALILFVNIKCLGVQLPVDPADRNRLIQDFAEAVLESIKNKDVHSLEKYAYTRKDHNNFAKELIEIQKLFNSKKIDNVKELTIKLEKEYALAHASELLGELLMIQKYGKRIGFKWKNAELKSVQPFTEDPILKKYGTSNSYKINWLVIEIKNNDKTMNVFINVHLTQDVLCIGSRLNGTILTAKELRRIRKWKPGSDIKVDRKLGQALLDSFATASLLRLNGVEHLITVSKKGFVIELPKLFDDTKPDIVIWKHPEEDVKLIETSNNSLIFNGQRYSDLIFKGQYWDITIEITAEVAKQLPGLIEFSAINDVSYGAKGPIKGVKRKSFGIYDGKRERLTFFRISDDNQLYEAPSVCKAKINYLPKKVELTFINGILNRVALNEEILKRKGEKDDLPIIKLPWKHPNPIGLKDIFGP